MSQQINLFNPIFLKKKKYFSANNMALALALVLGGSLAVVAYANMQVAQLRREAQTVTAQLASTQSDLAKVNAQFATRQKSASLQQESQKAAAELQSLQQVHDILKKGDFGDTQGYAAYLRAFARQSIDGLWLTGLSIQGAGKAIGIEGRALRPELVPAYITRLGSEAVLKGKSFAALEMRVPLAEEASARSNGGQASQTLAPFIEFNLHSADGDAGAGLSGAVRK